MKELRVYYETDHSTSGVDSAFDKEIERLAKRFSLKFQGSGVKIATKVRDLHYKKEKK